MTISKKNLSVVIVSFYSQEVIHNCIKSIDDEIMVIVVDNSNDRNFKIALENEYKNEIISTARFNFEVVDKSCERHSVGVKEISNKFYNKIKHNS